MDSYLIKAICAQMAEEFGGQKVLATLAGVSEPVWSTYCNFNKPDTTPPFHRILMIEDATGRRDFTEAAVARLGDRAEDEAADLNVLSARALEAIARVEVQMTAALADGVLTEAEKRDIAAAAQLLVDRARRLASAVAATETGAVKSRLSSVA